MYTPPASPIVQRPRTRSCVIAPEPMSTTPSLVPPVRLVRTGSFCTATLGGILSDAEAGLRRWAAVDDLPSISDSGFSDVGGANPGGEVFDRWRASDGAAAPATAGPDGPLPTAHDCAGPLRRSGSDGGDDGDHEPNSNSAPTLSGPAGRELKGAEEADTEKPRTRWSGNADGVLGWSGLVFGLSNPRS